MDSARKLLKAAAVIVTLMGATNALATDYCCTCKNGKMHTYHGPGWKASAACVGLCGTNGGKLVSGHRCDHDSLLEKPLSPVRVAELGTPPEELICKAHRAKDLELADLM
jgi:hypothetical protein